MKVSEDFKREIDNLKRITELGGRRDELMALGHYLPSDDPAQLRISVRIRQISAQIRDLEAEHRV